MKPVTTRRQFLTRAAGVTAGVSGLAYSGGLLSPGATLFGAEPVTRNGAAKYKFSLAAYSYRKLLSGDDPELTLADFIDDCAEFQLEGTELTSYYFPEKVTSDYLRSLKSQCFRLGLSISGTAIRNDFGTPNDEARQQDIQHVKKWIDYAEILGAPVIRVFAGKVARDSTPEAAHKLIVSSFEECCEYAGQHGVFLALENHGGPTSTADGLLALVRDIKSPWFGVNLDTGNFHSNDVYGELEQVAPYALNVQVKVVTSGPDKKKEPADFGRIAKILNSVGYRGFIVLEYEESEDPRKVCPAFIDQLRTAFA